MGSCNVKHLQEIAGSSDPLGMDFTTGATGQSQARNPILGGAGLQAGLWEFWGNVEDMPTAQTIPLPTDAN
jgi:hypothetical protein